jgi:hypothetical protein
MRLGDALIPCDLPRYGLFGSAGGRARTSGAPGEAQGHKRGA